MFFDKTDGKKTIEYPIAFGGFLAFITHFQTVTYNSLTSVSIILAIKYFMNTLKNIDNLSGVFY